MSIQQNASSASVRRAALAEFLRARRARVARSEVGLPAASRGRTHGLSREEVAYLSSISVTWYTWLEQARECQPSREVVSSVGATLRLGAHEQAHLLGLAGYVSPVGPPPGRDARAPGSVQRLLEAIDPSPAYAIFADWTFAGWNAAYEAMYPNVATVAPERCNLLRLIFTDPAVRTLMPDWEDASHRFLAEFRADAGPRLDAPAVSGLVADLLEQSPEFRAGWRSRDLELFSSRRRRFVHPMVGELDLEHHQMTPTDHHDIAIVVYTPASSADADRLARARATGSDSAR